MVVALIILVCLFLSAGAISVAWAATCTVNETIGVNTGGLNSASTAASLVYSEYNETGTLAAGTTVPATKHAQFLLTLVAGAATIDLTALLSTNGALVDGTGLKMQILRIKNLGANTMTFAEGAVNGYALGSSIVVQPGGVSFDYFADSLPDVAAADLAIDVAGTLVQTAEISIVLG